MQTTFTLAQLADPDVAEADKILRACVHCGFCTATCPTYVLLGDELDSPRGRIYLIKDMLENDRPATAEVVKHIDRCLSCLACMTTCPSGVHYMHLVDHARAHIEETYARPWPDRAMRALLAFLLPYPGRFRAALAAGWFAGRLIKLASWAPATRKAVPVGTGWRGLARRTAAMLALTPARLPDRPALAGPGVIPAEGRRKGRVALLQGCAQGVLAPTINAAAIRLLTRKGIEVVCAAGEGCCGALVHHIGREQQALAQARANIDAWMREIENGGLDAILITASGCGTTIKDYGFMLRNDPAYAAPAARVSALARDISEYLLALDLGAPTRSDLPTVAYQSACSLQHGQKIVRQPKDLLASCGFQVREPGEAHLCCGSAGTYNIMQPDIAAALRARKVVALERTGAQVIASGNIGCITHIAQANAQARGPHRRAGRLGARRTAARGAAANVGVNNSGRIGCLAYNARRSRTLRLFNCATSPQYGRATNREEDHHGCSQEKGEEVQDQEEGEESRRVEEEGHEALEREEEGGTEEGGEEEERSEEEGRGAEAGTQACSAQACSAQACSAQAGSAKPAAAKPAAPKPAAPKPAPPPPAVTPPAAAPSPVTYRPFSPPAGDGNPDDNKT